MRWLKKTLIAVYTALLVFTPIAKANALECTAILRDGKQVETHLYLGQTELLYKLEIEKPTQISLQSSFSISPSDYAHFQLENDHGQIYDLGLIHEGSYVLNANPISLPAGNYYIRITFDSNSSRSSWLYIGYSTIPDSDYWGEKLSHYYEFEDNNDLASANPVLDATNLYGAVLNYQESNRGLGYNDVDYYKIELASTSNVLVDFWAFPEVECALLDFNGNPVSINNDPNNAPCAFETEGERGTTSYATLNCGVLPAGQYLIKVTGKHTSVESSSYRIGWYSPDSLFSDVTSSTPHALDINWLYSEGISAGWETETGIEYRPYSEVARCDMAAFLYRLAGSPKYTPSSSEWSRFPDVNASTPHAREILWLASVGVTSGYPDGSFKPFATVTRCDMAAFLHRLAGGTPATGSDSFSDVNSSTPHAEDILWLSDAGVSTGFPDGSFKPYATVVRCDMAAFLHRMQGKVIL